MLQYPKDELYVCGHSLGGSLAYMKGGFGLMPDVKRIKKTGVCNTYGTVEAPLGAQYGQTVKVDYGWEHLLNWNGFGSPVDAHKLHSFINAFPRIRMS